MNMQEFLQNRLVAFDERGTTFMVPVVREMLEMSLESSSDLHEFVVECLAERNRHADFNLKFMYYWSVHTYLVDMFDCFQRLEKSVAESVQ